MENEKNNKQNDIISKAKESIYKFQKQFVKSNDNNNNNPSIKFSSDDINMTFNPRANYKKDNNVFDMNKEKETNNYKINEIRNDEDNDFNKNIEMFSKQNYFIKDNNDNEEDISDNDENNSPHNNEKEKIFNNLIEENSVLKSEINKLIDENKNIKQELLKNRLVKSPKENKIYEKHFEKNENDFAQKNKELSKMVKELNNRNKLQKQRIQDLEHIFLKWK